jgi:hypothetical protein
MLSIRHIDSILSNRPGRPEEANVSATNEAKGQQGGKVGKHAGGCHCGAVRFEVELDLGKPASRCNCTVCTKIAQTGQIVKPEALTVLKGESECSVYEWGMKTSKRYFCKHCGVHCFGRGHLEVLGGDYVSVNLHCLDDYDPSEIQVGYFDGRHNNWQGGIRSTPWPVRGGVTFSGGVEA